MLINKNSKYLFCSCFTVAGYFLISFLFMVVIRVCFPSRANFPLKVSRHTCRYCFQFYLHYHHIFYSRMHRQARFVGVGLFSGITFIASVLHVHVYTALYDRRGVEILGGQKRDRTEIIA